LGKQPHTPLRGPAHPAWKGDAARPEAKRTRARRLYRLGACERCGAAATDRHHEDGDTGNNTPENVRLLCRRCHMAVDGRLEQFRENGAQAAVRSRKAPQPCVLCGQLAKKRWKGRCHACEEFRRRNGFDRNEQAWARCHACGEVTTRLPRADGQPRWCKKPECTAARGRWHRRQRGLTRNAPRWYSRKRASAA
jgi:hypothetical protein